MTFKYKLQKRSGESEASSVIKFFTGTNKALSIPFEPNNTDYQKYLKWVSEGNTAEAAD